jgi:hypothetical protein
MQLITLKNHKTRGVSHYVMALPFTLKKTSFKKRRIMKIQIFHHAKHIILKKKSSKKNQNPF